MTPPSRDPPLTGGAAAADVGRFVQAQAGGVYAQALAEVRRGRKTGHWMWFVFPQLAGLGSSPTARAYAVRDLQEARACLAHPVLGPRLREVAAAAAALTGCTAREVFGSPDDLKLRSSLTLFEAADPHEPAFARALESLCGGARDPRTLALIAQAPEPEGGGARPGRVDRDLPSSAASRIRQRS